MNKAQKVIYLIESRRDRFFRATGSGDVDNLIKTRKISDLHSTIQQILLGFENYPYYKTECKTLYSEAMFILDNVTNLVYNGEMIID